MREKSTDTLQLRTQHDSKNSEMKKRQNQQGNKNSLLMEIQENCTQNGLYTIFYFHNSSLQYFTVMPNNQVTQSLKEQLFSDTQA
jgi:N-acetylglutamate synthase-like GNAT family acetyltransferase